MEGRFLRPLCSLAVALALGGCAHVGFKRAANTRDYQQASDYCHVHGDYPGCMTDQGWSGFDIHPKPRTALVSNPSLARTRTVAPAAAGHAVVVASWWKFGGTPDDLAQARQSCGVAGRAVSQTALACMKTKGWRGGA